MGIGQVELQGGLQRLQDFSILRQNEENRPSIEQLQTSVEFTQEMQQNADRVADSAQTSTDSEAMGEEGQGEEYAGDGGRRRRLAVKEEKKRPPDGAVFIKGNTPDARLHSLKGGDFSITI